MKAFKNPKCDKCKRPAKMGFIRNGKKTINLCERCICQLGAMKTEEEKNKFFEELEKGVNRL